MADQEQDSVSKPFHREGDAFVFDAPPDPKETARQKREDEQHEFARSQVKTNKYLALFTGILVIATFCTIGVGVWQAKISQRASNAAKSAAETAAQTLKEMQTGQGATDTHTLADQAKTQATQTTNLAIAAQDQAAAAKSFAKSAERIGHSMDNAVTNLGVEATNTEAARKSAVDEAEKTLAATIQNSRSETQALIATVTKPEKGFCDFRNGNVACVHFDIGNIGKTPAVFISYQAKLYWEEPRRPVGLKKFVASTFDPEKELKEMAVSLNYIQPEDTTMAADAKRTLDALPMNEKTDCMPGYHEGSCRYTVFGIIKYQDIFQHHHETGFCISYAFSYAEPPRYCGNGNWFDTRPPGYPPKSKEEQ